MNPIVLPSPRPTADFTSAPIGRIMLVLLVMIALAAITIPAVIVATAPRIVARHHVVVLPHRVVPQAELPPVEPVKFQDLDPDDARSFNATIPFSTDANPAARPFQLTGTDEDQARAIDCLATAVLYEAGDDTTGQRAVAQVVINRARHPAFPKTICGVVFQGSERSTGCQFTFTCNGALLRWRPTDAAWERAKTVAKEALNGSVFKSVGYSTHYHTDWVVPYWSSSLDKVAAVGTHLFFRWTGWWGTPPAFNRHVSDVEPVIALLAPLFDAHKSGDELAAANAGTIDAATLTDAALPAPIASDSDTFLVTLDPTLTSDSLPVLAARTCGERPYCKFMAWTDKMQTPASAPLNPQQIAAMSFSYLRDRSHGYDKALWNCAVFKRKIPVQCMKKQVFVPAAVPAPTTERLTLGSINGVPVTVPVRPAASITDGLAGIRRRSDSAPVAPPKVLAPKPAPTPAPKPN